MLAYLQVCVYLILIRYYCGYLITNNYRIMHVSFDDYSMVYLTAHSLRTPTHESYAGSTIVRQPAHATHASYASSTIVAKRA